MQRIPIALQLYTVREEAAKDFPRVLEQIAQIGYEGVELAGDYGLTAAQIRSLLDSLGLKAVGGHQGLDQLETRLMEIVEFTQTIGAHHVTIPYLPQEWRQSAGDWRSLAARMTAVGHQLRERGLQLCYHNHAFEFERFDGQYGLDLLYDTADPSAVHAQLDTFWVQYGGADPVAYLQKLSGRVPLLHVKDMDSERNFTEVGNGVLDWDAIFPQARASGVQWLIVEQDVCKRRPIESARISFEFMRNWWG